MIIISQCHTASTRILDAAIQKIETTVIARCKVTGSFDVSIIITYWNMPISGNDHDVNSQCYYGEGKGIIYLIANGAETASYQIWER